MAFRHSVSVAAAVIRDEQFLVIRRRDNGEWQPPGGILEQHESPDAGVAREVEEETGIKVQPLAITGIYKNNSLGVVCIMFLCRIIDDTGRFYECTETIDMQWLSIDDAGLLAPVYKTRMTDALAYRASAPHVPIRTHNGSEVLHSFPELALTPSLI